jgi:hypothetical protein
VYGLKRLNLLGEEDSGPQFFSPGWVQAAREFQTAKEDEETQRQLDISEKRRQATAKRLLKEKEKLQKAIITQEKRKLAAEAKAAEKQTQKGLVEAANSSPKEQVGLQKQSTEPNKVQKTRKNQLKRPTCVIITKEVEEVVLTTSTGRRVQRPGRFAS